MSLTLDSGEILNVGQLGGQFIILDDPVNLLPCEGEIRLSVDGSVRRWRVALRNGAHTAIVRTPIEAI